MISNSKDHFFTGRGLSNVFSTEDEWKAAQREAARKELLRVEAANQKEMADWCAVAWRNRVKIARDFNGGSHKREMAMKIKMSSKISLQDYADSILDREYRQPLKTLQEAMLENGWELVDKPTCCEEQINIRSMMGLPYFAQCTVCGKFISDISAPKFSKTGSSVRFIDSGKFADDTDWYRTWIAGTELSEG